MPEHPVLSLSMYTAAEQKYPQHLHWAFHWFVCVCVCLYGVEDPPFSIKNTLHGFMGCANAFTRMKYPFPFVVPHRLVPQLRLFYETDVGKTDTLWLNETF